ncbi:GT4 family glycosyltransferase PelF [bacterium]|nr:GT4 family glycosyltransferase PelF [bacterium]
MKICLVLEGSYPYVRGGVSTWVDGFIRSSPEHEFILWTINDLENKKGKFKYELPGNVIQIHENFLGSSLKVRVKNNLNIKFSDEERRALSNLIMRDNPDWQVLLECFNDRATRPVEFFLSEEFLDMLKDLSEREFPYVGFKDLFWTVRSMFLPLLYVLGQPIPDADIYHTLSTGYAGVLGGLAAMKNNKPFVLTEHGIYTREREEELLRSDWIIPYFKDLWISTFYMFSRFVYERADRVTSLYQKASGIQQELGCPPEKSVIIGNGLDYSRFSEIPLKADDGWIDIAAIVRFAPIKDLKTMIYTFSRLKQDVPNARLHILGGIEDEEYYEECMALIDYLEVEDIVIAGTVNVGKYLEKIDFTILTSISEGQPFALLESMAARRPVVATDVGSCRELIEGGSGDDLGNAGICVPPMHQSELLLALIEMCQHPTLRREMGEIGLKRVKQFHNYVEMVEKYFEVYEKAKEIWQESVLS